MLRNNFPILILLYLFAIPYCQAADDQRPAKRRRFIVPRIQVNHPESSWDRALRMNGLPTDAVELELSDKQITAIPTSLSLPALKKLDLTCNEITTIPDNINLPTLEELLLYENKITAVPASLHHLPALKELNLGANKITTIPDNINSPTLEDLNLEDNKIMDLPASLHHLPALKHLDLSGNGIITIPASLNHLSALTNLHLRYNKITVIPANLKLAEVLYLDLSGNQISHINTQTFLEQFPKLWLLNLDYNPIEPQDVNDLKMAAQKQGRDISVIALNIGPQEIAKELV